MKNKIFIVIILFNFILSAAQDNTANREDEVFINPEFKAEYPGGLKEFYSYISQNIVIPEVDNDIELKFPFTFIIEIDGSIQSITFIKTPEYGMGEEITRVVKLSPLWKPASHEGKIVRSKVTLPITISLKAKSLQIFKIGEVDVQPEFPGGNYAFSEQVRKEIKIPKSIDRDLNIKVFVTFVVDRDGSIINVKCPRDPGYGIGREAERAVRQITTKWLPGKKNGKSVCVAYTLPIVIKTVAGTLKVQQQQDNMWEQKRL